MARNGNNQPSSISRLGCVPQEAINTKNQYSQYRIKGSVSRKEYGGLKLNQAHRLKDLEGEDNRLKRLVADLTGTMGSQKSDTS